MNVVAKLIAIILVFGWIFAPIVGAAQGIRGQFFATVSDVNYTFELLGDKRCMPSESSLANRLEAEFRRADFMVNKSSSMNIFVNIDAVYLDREKSECVVFINPRVFFRTTLKVPHTKEYFLIEDKNTWIPFSLQTASLWGSGAPHMKFRILEYMPHIIVELIFEMVDGLDEVNGKKSK